MSQDTSSSGIFAIRGNLDGEIAEEFSEKEQFIGLKIDKEEFYLPIALVSEIVMIQPITFVPSSHRYVEGVINLRGTIMPSINLRKLMGLQKGEVTSATRMIIVTFQDVQFALIVDGITYVISLIPSEIEEQSIPQRSNGVDLISRISKSRDEVVGILDLSKIIGHFVSSEEEFTNAQPA